MANPLFWLGLSVLLVAIGLLALLVVVATLLRELSRASRSAERLCDILARDLPPTLEAIRLTGLEITELTDDVNEGVHHAGEIIQQIDQGLTTARHQAQQMQVGSRSLWTGVKAAWQAWQSPPRRKRPRRLHSRHGRSESSRPVRPRRSQAAALDKPTPSPPPQAPQPPPPPAGDLSPPRPFDRVD